MRGSLSPPLSALHAGTLDAPPPGRPAPGRFDQLRPSGETLYLSGPGVLAERHAGVGSGEVRWTNDLIIGGRLVGVHIQKADESTARRYFHTDHLGSISVITSEAGGTVERLCVACPLVGAAEPGECLGQAAP